MSAFPSIVLQKSKVAGLKIFRENTMRRAVADSYDLNRVTEVACEFCVRPCGPSHLVHESRAHGPRNFGHRRKSSFATQSPPITDIVGSAGDVRLRPGTVAKVVLHMWSKIPQAAGALFV